MAATRAETAAGGKAVRKAFSSAASSVAWKAVRTVFEPAGRSDSH
jgi:hypothetical protein